jgi:hypothetical protein
VIKDSSVLRYTRKNSIELFNEYAVNRDKFQLDLKSKLDKVISVHDTDILWKPLFNNILIYGVGSKKELLVKIAGNTLNGEDILCIDGDEETSCLHNKTLKVLLGTISRHILKLETFDNINDDLISSTEKLASRV